MDLLARWWNNRWYRMRRDIWLETDGRRWIVRGRVGGHDGREVRYEFDREYQAHAMVDRLRAATPDDWKNITRLIQPDDHRRRTE
jgi:hypothetical protein